MTGGLERIRESVIITANKEASNIVDAAKRHGETILAARQTELDREYERLFKVRSSAIEDEYSRRLIQFRGAASKQILDKQNLLIQKVFEKARDTILDWPEDKYGNLMRGLIETVTEGAGGCLRVHEDERGLFSGVLSTINKTRIQENEIVLDDKTFLSERGGFIFLGSNYEVDQTLDTLLKDIEQEMLPMIAKDLFS